MEENNPIEQVEIKEEVKVMSNKKKAQILSLILVLSIVIVFIAVLGLYFFIINYPTVTFSYKSISDLKKTYELANDGEFLSNINYEDYIQPMSLNIFDSEYYKSKFLLSEYGASDSNTALENTSIINNIISQLDGKSGVIFVDGNYKINPIELKNKITIIINENCSLIGPSYNESQENNTSFCIVDSNSKYNKKALGLLYAIEAKNINIYGPGSIICNGTSYFNNSENEDVSRPLSTFSLQDRVNNAKAKIKGIKDVKQNTLLNGVSFYDCSDVEIENLKIYDSLSSSCVFVDSDKVSIKDCVFENNLYAQDVDGIVLVGCQNAKVFHSFISTANDGLVVKANSFEKSESITFNRCSVISMNDCFRIGSQTTQPVKSVSCVNCCFLAPKNICGAMCGIEIDSVDSSDIDGITIDNVYMDGVSSVFLIWLGSRMQGGSQVVGSIENVKITNIEANNIEMASAVSGIKYSETSYYVKKITLANWNVSYRNCKEVLNMGSSGMMDYMSKDPSIDKVICTLDTTLDEEIVKDIPVYGIFARYVYDINLINVKIEPRSSSKLDRDNILNIKDRYFVDEVSIK